MVLIIGEKAIKRTNYGNFKKYDGRQLRAGGGIMTLDEPRQGYFLGKLVRKAKRAKKVVKSPLGKAALLGATAFGIPGTSFGGLLGRAGFGGAAKGIFGNTGGIGALLGRGGKLETLGNLFRVGGEAGEAISIPRVLAGLGITGVIAAPFLMGGDDEEVDPGVDVQVYNQWYLILDNKL